jgi:cytochrome P450
MVHTLSDVPVAPGQLPVLGHLIPFARDPIGFLGGLREHGDLVEINLAGKRMYVPSRTESLREVLVNEARNFDKGYLFERFRVILGNGLLTSTGDFHRRQRKIVQPAFHRDQIARYTEAVREEITETVGPWPARGWIDLCPTMQEMTFQVVTTVLFAAKLGKPERQRFRHAMTVALRGLIMRAYSPLPFLERLPTPGNQRFENAVSTARTILDDVVAAHRKGGDEPGGLLSLLLDTAEPEQDDQVLDEQLRDEVVSIITAGTETAAGTLSWLFYELARNPGLERRLHQELDDVLGGRPVELGDIARLEFVSWLLNETLRRYTPNWILTRRTVNPVVISGTRLEPHTEMMFSLTTVHRDPNVFAEPYRFDPDRWSPERSAMLPRGVFMPFGAGNRKCVGDSFAWTVMVVAVATIAQRWRVVVADPTKVRELPRATLQPKGLVGKLVRRRDTAK